MGKKNKIGDNVEILPFTHIENATLESGVKVGPFSRLRPGSLLSKGSRVGNFVEVKKSNIKTNVKRNVLNVKYHISEYVSLIKGLKSEITKYAMGV